MCSLYFLIDGFIRQFFSVQSASVTFPLYYSIQQPPPSYIDSTTVLPDSAVQTNVWGMTTWASVEWSHVADSCSTELDILVAKACFISRTVLLLKKAFSGKTFSSSHLLSATFNHLTEAPFVSNDIHWSLHISNETHWTPAFCDHTSPLSPHQTFALTCTLPCTPEGLILYRSLLATFAASLECTYMCIEWIPYSNQQQTWSSISFMWQTGQQMMHKSGVCFTALETGV